MWQNEMILMLRHYIEDLGCPPTYSDDRLTECLLVAAIRVHNEVDFSYGGSPYVVNLETLDISPDPTFGDSRNENFMLLTAYCAAAMIAASEFKTAAGQNILVQDGGSVIDMRYVSAQKAAVSKFYSDSYAYMRIQYALNNLSGHAVIGPTSTYYAYTGGYSGSYGGFRSQPYF